MEPVLTPDEMRRADEACIAAGTPPAELMDRAAAACASVAIGVLGGGYGRRVTVLAGKGNNGGDGVAAAVHLSRAGAAVRVVLAGEGTPQLERARRAGVRIEPFTTAVGGDLVVDAIFGTGFAGAPRGDAAAGISATEGHRVLSIDIPSGVAGRDGSVEGRAVRADVTVAIASLKPGHLLPPGTHLCGRVDVAEIGIPVESASTSAPVPGDLRSVLPPLEPDTHKYKRGALAIVAGSPGMTGAAVLAASAAVRTGAGLVYLAVPRASLDAVEQAVVEAVKLPLPDAEGQLDAKSLEELPLEKLGAIAIGPGIGRGTRAADLVRRALEIDLPLVIDADGLTALSAIVGSEPDVLRSRTAPTILTPHAGELSRLIEPSGDRLTQARTAAARLGAVVHLKGEHAVTATQDGRAWVNTTGNPALATAGTGDVLTGVIVALCARGLADEDAAWAGALLHGLAGDVVAASVPVFGAAEVAEALPGALRRAGRPARRTPGPVRTVLEAR